MNIKKIASYTACGVAALAAATLVLPRHVSIERSAMIGPNFELGLANIADVAA